MDTRSSFFFPAHHQPGLFRSHAWLDAWQKSWGDHPNLQLLSLDPALNDPTQTIGRARVVKKGILPISNAFPAGTSIATAPGIRSEYFFFPAYSTSLEEDIGSYLDKVLKHSWDQFYIADMLRSSPAYDLLLTLAQARNLYVVHEQIENTYAIDLRARDFAGYLRGLGKNTRLKLFNRRKNLAALGDIRVENLWPDRKGFYQLLNSFHQQRWGKDCYRGRNQKFIDQLLDNLHDENGEADFSVLSIAGKPVSVVFDIRFKGRQYNLQSGYLEQFHKHISLGTLHFGYQIEAAFQNPQIEFYDFMAGKGKHADYKKFLVNCQDEFASVVLARSAWLKIIYKLYTAIRGKDLLR
jgi:hypothetical protein